MLFLLSAGILVLIAWLIGWWILVVGVFLLMFFAPFIDTPGGYRSGKLEYFGPLLIGEKERRGKIVLHGGTLFDYMFTLDGLKPGRERKSAVLRELGYGLEALAHSELDDSVVLEGTSYFPGERSLGRYGFRTEPISFFRFTILVFNYPLLFLSKRYVTGRWEFPSLRNVRTFRGTVGSLRRSLKKKQSGQPS